MMLAWTSNTPMATYHSIGSYIFGTIKQLAIALYSSINKLASFPGRSHLQYLIAYSMQILEVGTAWERGYKQVTLLELVLTYFE